MATEEQIRIIRMWYNVNKNGEIYRDIYDSARIGSINEGNVTVEYNENSGLGLTLANLDKSLRFRRFLIENEIPFIEKPSRKEVAKTIRKKLEDFLTSLGE